MKTSWSALVGLLIYQLVHQLEQVILVQQEGGEELVIKEDDLEVAQEVKMLEGKIIRLM